MSAWTQIGAPVLAAFLASLVECVEALTVVLAFASLRGWRSALWGAAAALLVLSTVLACLGRSVAAVPLVWAQRIVGGLLLLFGLRWLRKAILRAAGVIALHDESAAYAKTRAGLGPLTPAETRLPDPIAFWGCFKIVMLEGIEVIFIVIAIAANGGALWPACAGALAALALVIALGAALHRPLARIPENSLKFVVGLLLVSLGCFWLGEGLALDWPGGDFSVPALIVFYALVAQSLVVIGRRAAAAARSLAESRTPATVRSRPARPSSGLRVALDELLGLFIDDRRLAFGAGAWVLGCWLMGSQAGLGGAGSWVGSIVFAAGLACLLAYSVYCGAAPRSLT